MMIDSNLLPAPVFNRNKLKLLPCVGEGQGEMTLMIEGLVYELTCHLVLQFSNNWLISNERKLSKQIFSPFSILAGRNCIS